MSTVLFLMSVYFHATLPQPDVHTTSDLPPKSSKLTHNVNDELSISHPFLFPLLFQ